LNLTIDEIQEVVTELENDSKALRSELFKLAWYMRGAMSIEEAFTLDYHDRELVGNLIKENLEITKETQMPHF
jgi:hypothetical protein